MYILNGDADGNEDYNEADCLACSSEDMPCYINVLYAPATNRIIFAYTNTTPPDDRFVSDNWIPNNPPDMSASPKEIIFLGWRSGEGEVWTYFDMTSQDYSESDYNPTD